jgi:hypothetical protein
MCCFEARRPSTQKSFRQGQTTLTDRNFCFLSGYGYGHPGGFNPFLLNAGWLDAAYMNYAWSDYFRVQQTHPLLSKGECWFFVPEN